MSSGRTTVGSRFLRLAMRLLRLRHHHAQRTLELLVDDAPAIGASARLHLPGAEADHRRAVLAQMPSLQVSAYRCRIGRRLRHANAGDVVAGRYVAGALEGAFGQRDATGKPVHRRREWALLARAGHRERGAEA